MEIPRETDEFAVVERLAAMLCDLPETDYQVTLSYSLFGTMICWIVQRIRSNEPSLKNATKTMVDEFRKETVNNLRTLGFDFKTKRIELKSKNFGPPLEVPTWQHVNLFDFLVSLRNSIAHGDHRCVRAIHEKKNGVNILVGYRFTIEIDINNPLASARDPSWKLVGDIVLKRHDFHILGSILSRRFCDALQFSAKRTENLSRNERAA